ncbi:MAG: enoyl-CoA hydratase-related protein, partial [Phyllobacterium sp.]
QEAREAGLIYRVVEAAELEASVMKAAGEIAAKPPEAMRITRDLLRLPREAVTERMRLEVKEFTARLQSEEARNAMVAFLTRKKTGEPQG